MDALVGFSISQFRYVTSVVASPPAWWMLWCILGLKTDHSSVKPSHSILNMCLMVMERYADSSLPPDLFKIVKCSPKLLQRLKGGKGSKEPGGVISERPLGTAAKDHESERPSG